MKKPKLGGGKRFSNMTRMLEGKGYSEESSKKIAGSIMWKKYGKKKGAKLIQKGKRGY